jgi:phosphoglycolate phosphatase-like HAD superfamily hydrolase
MIREGTFVNISGVAIAMAREHGVSKDEEVRAGFLRKMDEVMDSTGPGKDLLTLLNQFQEDNFRMGLVTFMRRPRLTRRLEKWNLTNYFQSVTTPEGMTEFKPSPKPFIKTIQELGVEPSNTFAVGDEPVDMMGAKAAGAGTVGIPRGFFSEEELKKAGADNIIRSLPQLPGVLRSIISS